MFYKPEIRDKMQRRRKELDLVSISQAALGAAAQVVQLSEFLNAQQIGCYLPIEGELDPSPLLHSAHNLKKKLYLPVISASGNADSAPLEFHHYVLGDPLLKGVHGISGPDHRTRLLIEINRLDLIFVPLVAFDAHCHRIGRGAGHYDKTLNLLKEKGHRMPCLVGLGYEFQKIPAIVPDKWDVPLDIVVTEKNIYRRNV